MNIQAKIENILNRINNKEHGYSVEELYIIKEIPELTIAFFKLYSKDSTIIEPNKYIVSFITYMFDVVNKDALSKEEYENVFLNLLPLWLENECYGKNLVDISISDHNLDESIREKANKIVDDFFTDPNNKFEDKYLSIQLFLRLLDYKRFDVILSLESETERIQRIEGKTHVPVYPDSIHRRIRNECPEDIMPQVLKKFRPLDSYNQNDTIKELFASYVFIGVEKIKDDPEVAEKEIKQIKELIYNKIVNAQDLSLLNENDDMFNTFIETEIDETREKNSNVFKIDQAVEIARLLYERNCLQYAEFLIQQHVITKEEVDEKTKFLVQKGLRLFKPVITELNDDIIKNLVDYGDLEFLLNFPSQKELIKKHESYIIYSINKNPIYKKLTKCNCDYTEFPEIFATLLENLTPKKINFDNIGTDDITKKALLNHFRRNPEASIWGSLNPKTIGLADYLIENGVTSVIGNSMPDQIILDNKERYLNCLFKDFYETCIFVTHRLYLFKDDDETMSRFLGEPILTEKVIETINHDEKLESLYNDNTFQKTKLYYAKKHNLNLKHFEEMEKQLGPKIIRYIEEKKLHDLINLDDEDFYKLLNIFPKETYEMTDLKAAYESLIQRLFVIENNDAVNIFHNFIHAVETNDYETLSKLEDELIININLDFLRTILNKYQLKNIKTTKELLTHIIEKMTTIERDIYLNILHELTDNYVENARNYFRKNNYFDKKHPEYADLCNKILTCKREKNLEELYRIIELLENTIDNDIFNKISIKYWPVQFLKTNEDKSFSRRLLSNIIESIYSSDNIDDYLPLIKELTDYCHSKAKEKHIKETLLEQELELAYNLNPRSKEKAIIKHLIINSNNYDISFIEDENEGEIPKSLFEDEIVKKLEQEGLTKSLAKEVIGYYRGDKLFINDISEIQKNIGLLVKVGNELIKEYSKSEMFDMDLGGNISSILDSENKIKREYYLPKQDGDVYQILLELKIDLLRNNLFNNEEMYNSLVNLMKKKKLHLLPANIKKLTERSYISSDYTDIASFINYYVPIVETERKRLLSIGKSKEDVLKGLSSILIQAETFSSISSVYYQVLGPKDFRLIKSNPSPNSACRLLENDGRLKKAITYTLCCYKRQEITTPAFDEIVNIENGTKQIEIILGNFTHPSNLTHGERTGSCMRIGGNGEKLLDFCLTDKNGFHIRFEDPDTHEYISRVSGFRNGNTVFLNELRFSCLEKYSNENIVESCKIAARRIIELSKDSDYPIQNIVITKKYAMENTNDKIVNFGIENNKTGLKDFYSDIDVSGVVLATNATNGQLVPINFDKTYVPTYKPVRSKPQFLSTSSELTARINRVAAIKKILNDASLKDIDSLQFEDGIICGIVTDDWYLYVDINLNVHYDYITIDSRAKEELIEYTTYINDMIENNKIKVDEEYGVQPHIIR